MATTLPPQPAAAPSGIHSAVLCFGSNCGDSHSAFMHALQQIERDPATVGIDAVSEAYRTPEAYAQHTSAAALPTYLNMVVSLRTRLGRDRLDVRLKKLETDAGRDEQCRLKGEVPLDLDIVIFDGEVIRRRDYESDFFRIGHSQIKP